jgi:hypothetical protein
MPSPVRTNAHHDRSARLRWWQAIAASSGVVWAVGDISGATDPVSVPAHRVDPPTPAIVIGDSAISALRWTGADNAVIGFEHTLDLESCRRLYNPSCRGREGRTPLTAYAALGEHGRIKSPSSPLAQRRIVVDGAGIHSDRAKRLAPGTTRSCGGTRSDVDHVSPGSVGNYVTFAQSNQIIRDLVASGRTRCAGRLGQLLEDQARLVVTDGALPTDRAWERRLPESKMAFVLGEPADADYPSVPQNPCLT